MRRLIIAAALAITGLVAGTADAMPVVTAKTPSFVVKADYPCGRGWHLNRRGDCVRSDRWDRPPPPRWHRPPPRWDDRPGRWDDGPRHYHRPPPYRY